jgi:hypothetical protein
MTLPHYEDDLFRGGQGRSTHAVRVDVKILTWLLLLFVAGVIIGCLFRPQ